MTETVKLQVNNLNQAVPNNNLKTEYNEHVGLRPLLGLRLRRPKSTTRTVFRMTNWYDI